MLDTYFTNKQIGEDKMADLRDTALSIIEKDNIGVMSTVTPDNKSQARYMTFYNEGFILYTLTDKRTAKVDEIESNPYAHVLLGYEEGLFNKNFVEIEAEVAITEDDSLIEHLWMAPMNAVFEGKDDPNIMVLKLTPKKVLVRGTKNQEVEAIDLT